jgi:Flp pilus assembly protein TadG
MRASFLPHQDGNVAVAFGLALPVLIMAVGSVADYSALTNKRAELQKVADGAALAGAKVLLSSNRSASEREAEAAAAVGAIVDQQVPGAAKVVTASLATRSVSVQLNIEKSLDFAGFLGSATKTVGVMATATYNAQSSPCLIALGTAPGAGIELVGSAKITATRCSVQSNAAGSNSIRTQGAASIKAANICASGSAGRAQTSPPATSECPRLDDPYEERPVKCGPNQSIACTVSKPDTSGKKTTPVSTYTGPCLKTNYKAQDNEVLQPGVYCGGLSIGRGVTMAPGFYQIQDGPLSLQANASLTGLSVSILLSGNDAVLDLQGSPKMKLTAMTTGPLAGIAVASNTVAPPALTSSLQGSPEVSLTGSLWLPGQTLKMQGSPTLTMEGANDKTIAYSFDLQGSPDLIIKADQGLELQAGRAQLRLVQ